MNSFIEDVSIVINNGDDGYDLDDSSDTFRSMHSSEITGFSRAIKGIMDA